MVVCGFAFFFSCSTQHLTRSLRSLVSYRVKHLKRNFISTRAYVLFSIYHILQLFSACTMKVVSLPSPIV